MVIEVVPAQLYSLAEVLEAAAADVTRAAGALADSGAVGGPLGGAVAGFGETTGTAARCLGAELTWLGGAVSAVADSWLGLDAQLLPVAGRGVAE